MKMKIKIRPIVSLLCVTIALLITSCVDGFKENELFSSGIANSTLISPDSIVFTPSADGTSVTISWPVVFGAGGYQVSFYKVDDPANPVVVGAENQIVDGCSVTRAIAEDTKYKMIVKTLGNVKDSNKDATDATVAAYSTLLPVYATIPTGTDLSQYFASKPIPSSTTELAYQLEAGGSYTMSGNVPLGLTNITMRGDKITHATVKMTAGAFLSDGAALKLKFIDFDCSGFTGTGVITFNSTLNTSASSYLSAYGGMMVSSPVGIQSCKITGLANPLIYDNGKKYALQTLLIKDCIIGLNTATKNCISMGAGYVRDLNISNSTLYNQQIATGGYLIQYANGVNAPKITGAGWATGSVTFVNNTLWQICPNTAIVNYSGFASSAGNALTVQKCIFVDCDKVKSISSTMCVNSATPSRTFGNNTYWVAAGTTVTTSSNALPPGCPLYEIFSSTNKFADNSGTVIQSDPQLKDPLNANFKVQGTAQVTGQTGDPRWLQ